MKRVLPRSLAAGLVFAAATLAHAQSTAPATAPAATLVAFSAGLAPTEVGYQVRLELLQAGQRAPVASMVFTTGEEGGIISDVTTRPFVKSVAFSTTGSTSSVETGEFEEGFHARAAVVKMGTEWRLSASVDFSDASVATPQVATKDKSIVSDYVAQQRRAQFAGALVPGIPRIFLLGNGTSARVTMVNG